MIGVIKTAGDVYRIKMMHNMVVSRETRLRKRGNKKSGHGHAISMEASNHKDAV